MYGSKGKLAKLNYLDIKLLLDRCIVKNKRGSLSEREIQILVKDWHAGAQKEIFDRGQ
jgi:hypothetical protein